MELDTVTILRSKTIALPAGYFIGLLLVVMLANVTLAQSAELSDQALRGKRIYVEGESESGSPINAIVSSGGTAISASILPCIGCHGDDGKGRPEGGVVPSDITWNKLTATYGHEHAYGRAHPAFDEKSVAVAIIAGADPAANALDVAMPRYDMSEADMADLIVYLQHIEDDLDPGLTEDTIRIGSILPLEGSLQGLGLAMKQVLDAYFTDVNASGGIHGRKIELVVADYKPDAAQSGWQVRDLLEQQSVFAMVSGYAAGIETQIAALAEELEVPMIGPHTQLPQEGNGLDRHSFYLVSGLIQQSAVLARHGVSAKNRGSRQVAVVRPVGEIYDRALQRVEAELQTKGETVALSLMYQPPFFDATDVAQVLSEKGIDTVLFFGQAADLRRLANEASERDWHPDLLLPGVFAGKDMFEVSEQFAGRVFVAYSSIPSDHTTGGVQAFEKLHSEHDLDYQHSTAQISAYVAAEVLVESLKRSGRALSREKLMTALESLAEFQPGLMPPISYNRSRRIGAFGGYVVMLDLPNKNFAQASNWVSLQL
jgi:ABC-type branched-subunit amino acid transport system substrate-binding protein